MPEYIYSARCSGYANFKLILPAMLCSFLAHSILSFTNSHIFIEFKTKFGSKRIVGPSFLLINFSFMPLGLTLRLCKRTTLFRPLPKIQRISGQLAYIHII